MWFSEELSHESVVDLDLELPSSKELIVLFNKSLINAERLYPLHSEKNDELYNELSVDTVVDDETAAFEKDSNDESASKIN